MDQSTGLTLNCDLGGGDQAKRKVTVRLATPAGQAFPVRFDPAKNCYRAEVTDLQRSFAGGYVKITDYDEFDLEIDCAETAPAPLPLDFHLPDPANITGLVPILCHPDGTPTGIPVQLSKNWHHGSYLRAYALVPLQPGLNRYRLRIVYGFYGTLPSASHAQLSLVGYGGNQRWDQLALGSGGEAITFDVDMSLTEVAICDVRLPLGQQGIDGNPWGWTDAGWGGDWLGVFDNNGKKLALAGIKTAYAAPGPCLSDVAYRGAYGSDRPVLLEARVQLPRTDDYGRTFQKLTYRFRAPLAATNSWFMSKSYYATAADETDSGQEIAYGNVNGLIATCPVPAEPEAGDWLIPPTELHGPGPWWVTFPNHDPAHTGYIAMVVRDYRAVLGGRTYENPFLEVRVAGQRRGSATLKANIVPPPQVTAYQPGDVVELDTQWLHLVRTAEDYGGANAAYRRHLEKYPRSWKTTYREVVGNKLRVTVSGGTLRSQYPIIIEPRRPEVKVTIRGGIGHVPIRFEGLDAADEYAVYEQTGGRLVKLDQAVHGNDYWQTDYDPATGLYQLKFNLPLDGKKTSHWIFKRRP